MNLKDARKRGKLAQFIRERKGQKGDSAILNTTVQIMTKTPRSGGRTSSSGRRRSGS